MNYSHPQVRRTARRIPILCALYFVVFAFLFLYLLQCDLLAQTQYWLSSGQTVYHPLLAALMCTSLLTLLGLLLGRLLPWLPLRAKAAAWFPSFLAIGWLTHWHFPQFGDTGSSPSWYVWVLLFVAYALWLFVVSLIADSSKEKGTFSVYAWPNALQLILLSVMAVCLSNTDVVLHHTLRSLRQLGVQNYESMLVEAQYERHPSRQLSTLTALALSETGRLGDDLFVYPQPHGVDGLLPTLSDSLLFVNLPKAVGHHLGYQKGDHTPTPFFLQVISEKPKATDAARDYRLCAHLLQRDLDGFASLLLESDTLPVPLPRHYREALVLRQRLDSLAVPRLSDSLLVADLAQFDSLRLGQSPLLRSDAEGEREFQCRRRFPGTYWLYYFYP